MFRRVSFRISSLACTLEKPRDMTKFLGNDEERVESEEDEDDVVEEDDELVAVEPDEPVEIEET